jgi:hypothetical protein
MSVDTAISEAHYGIDKMKENTNQFDFYFKGTLACLKGILDYVLEEYNVKYSLGIGDSENLDVGNFESKAKICKNPAAVPFIAFYKTEKAKLLADPKCGKLLARHGSRDIAIHRKELPKNVAITVHEFATTSVSVVVKDARGNIISTAADSPPPSARANPPPQIQYYLRDWPSDDIPTLCEYTLDALRRFIASLRTNYP